MTTRNMAIKLIIFDLDGVLVDTKDIHYFALNRALGKKYAIQPDEHLKLYDGLKTRQKLEMLTKEKGLPASKHDDVWNNKQRYTAELLMSIGERADLKEMFETLKMKGYNLAVCSNSIRQTVNLILKGLGVYPYIDYTVSNQDVSNPKPHPEMYWDAMINFNALPEETLIVEDSPHGLLAAHRSGAHVFRVKNSSYTTFDNINKQIAMIEQPNETKKRMGWEDVDLNVLIPMAGAGSRFEKAGYTFPKPLIDVHGVPMIQYVVENLNIKANYIYVVQASHRAKYNLDTLLKLITPNCTIVEVDGLTEGAACTALAAKEFINNDKPLFFANSDQYVVWDSIDFMYRMNESNADGGIVTFKASHPKWSFAKVNDSGYVTEVAEKNPISDNATVGFYYWKHGSYFVKYAEQMIEKDIRVNNEFYVCPVFNEAIADGKLIKAYTANKMYGLGTPEDLEYFIKQQKEDLNAL